MQGDDPGSAEDPLPFCARIRRRLGLTPGSAIRQARERAGLTRSELSKRARMSCSAITQYGSGHAHPMLETAKRLVEACGFGLRVEVVDASPQRQAALPELRQLRDRSHPT